MGAFYKEIPRFCIVFFKAIVAVIIGHSEDIGRIVVTQSDGGFKVGLDFDGLLFLDFFVEILVMLEVEHCPEEVASGVIVFAALVQHGEVGLLFLLFVGFAAFVIHEAVSVVGLVLAHPDGF